MAIGSRLASALARHEAACVMAAAAICAQPWAAGRRLWFDELFTFYLSRLPDLGSLFHAIPADGNPPLYYFMARTSMAAFGGTEIALRLPSILGFMGAALAAYLFVRRRRGPVFGLFAMLALACCANARYATEARPYALLLGFTGLTLVSWQAAAAGKGRRLIPLLGVTAGIAGAVAAHHYGALNVGLPLIFGEAVRARKSRRADLPMWGACAAGLLALALTLPFAAATRHIMLNYVRECAAFWAKPSLWSIRSYGSMICLWLPGVFLAIAALGNAAPKDGAEPEGSDGCVPGHEVAAAAGLALLPLAVIGLTWVTTGYYLDRYALGAALGLAILLGLAAPSAGRSGRNAAAAAALCLPLLAAQVCSPLAHAVYRKVLHRPAVDVSALLTGAPGTAPIVVASAMAYAPEWWYGSPGLRARLHYLADLPYAVQQPDFLPEFSLVTNQWCVPSKVDDYRQFVSTHDHFLLYSVGAPQLEWVAARLQSEGWWLTVLRTDEHATLYVVDGMRPPGL